MRVVGPGMLLSFMYESMYNYVGAFFIRLPCFSVRSFGSFGFVTGFSSLVWMLLIAVALIGKNKQ